jgi:predicted ATPase
LRPRRLLVVLDNCEHLVTACAELADHLLRNCPELTILATSREPLQIAGETVWQVLTLSVPAAGTKNLKLVEASEAVRLFVQRAASASPGFVLTESNAWAISRLCRRLDGIPLALELASARVTVLSVELITDRLDDVLELLTAGRRLAPARQQTLRATLDWSYGLLEDREQRLFERLSVFAGGWTLEAAEAICADDGIVVEAVLDLLGNW